MKRAARLAWSLGARTAVTGPTGSGSFLLQGTTSSRGLAGASTTTWPVPTSASPHRSQRTTARLPSHVAAAQAASPNDPATPGLPTLAQVPGAHAPGAHIGGTHAGAHGRAFHAGRSLRAGQLVQEQQQQQQAAMHAKRGGCNTPNLAEVLYEAGAGEHPRTEQLLALLDDATPEELTSGATAAAVLGYDDPRFLSALSRKLQMVIGDFTPNQLTALSVAFARLGHFDMDFKDRLADQVVLKIKHFEGPSLGQLVRSFGAMEYYDSDLLDAVGDHLVAHMPKFDPEDIAHVVYAFSKVGKVHQELLVAVDDHLSPLIEEGKVDPHAMVSLVEGYSRLGCHRSDIVALVAEAAERRPADFDPASLPLLVAAFARVGHCDPDVYNALAGPIATHLDKYTPKDISRLACAYGDAGCCRREIFDRIADDIIPRRLPEFTATGLCNILRSFGRAGYYSNSLSAAVANVLKDVPYLVPEQAA